MPDARISYLITETLKIGKIYKNKNALKENKILNGNQVIIHRQTSC